MLIDRNCVFLGKRVEEAEHLMEWSHHKSFGNQVERNPESLGSQRGGNNLVPPHQLPFDPTMTPKGLQFTPKPSSTPPHRSSRMLGVP